MTKLNHSGVSIILCKLQTVVIKSSVSKQVHDRVDDSNVYDNQLLKAEDVVQWTEIGF